MRSGSVLAGDVIMNEQSPVILCVDDEEAYLRLLEDILVRGG